MRCRTASGLCTALLLVLVIGCSGRSSEDEKQAKETFLAFEAAVKAKDPDKIWDLLATDSREDADRAAKTLKEAYLKADTKEKKAEQEKKAGLKGDELTGLTGRLFLKSNQFHSGEAEELPGSTFESVVVTGDQAKVTYIENTPKKEEEKLKLVRENSKWKVAWKIEARP
ncbi:MAG TPA: hypothetical protein VEL76_31470 [Gemmataceae bacterium]|nr:hypothetical protein [Gemmataceae bacterium]